MKLRVSDGYSAAVEFSATSEPEFRKNLRRAMLELSGKIRTHRVGGRVFMQAQLHVRTDIRKTWISSNYPNGAVPISVQLGSDPLPGVWGRCMKSHDSGNEFDRGITGLCSFAVNEVSELRKNTRTHLHIVE